jgi:hypothetical protein
MAAQQSATRRNNKALAPVVEAKFGMPQKVPRSAQLLKFFEEYVKQGSIAAAARAAGYQPAWIKNHSTIVVERYRDYYIWLQAHYAQQVVRQIAIDQDVVLQEVARIGMVNEWDYLVFEAKEVDGKTVQVPRRKRLEELTREQMTAIRVYKDGKGELDYTLRDKEGKLSELAKHVGLLNEKIILEHRHRHLHAVFDLSKVPQKKLDVLEAQFEVLLNESGNAGRAEAK